MSNRLLSIIYYTPHVVDGWGRIKMALSMYLGRRFIESERYDCQERTPAGYPKNKVWLYTVDKAIEVESGKSIIQIVRWRAKNDSENAKLKLWGRFRTYNIRSLEQWDVSKAIVDRIIDDTNLDSDPGFQLTPEVTTIEVPTDEVDERERELAEAHERENVQREKRRRMEKKISKIKAHRDEYKAKLEELRSIVESPESTETDIHGFISSRRLFWIFGLQYSDIKSKVSFPPKNKKYEFDFMLERDDGFLDLVELKGPNVNLFDKKTSRRYKLNANLSEALGQVLVYLDECDRTDMTGLFKPTALIVIGTKNTDNAHQRKLLMSHLARVNIMTYDDLITYGDRLLRHITGT